MKQDLTSRRYCTQKLAETRSRQLVLTNLELSLCEKLSVVQGETHFDASIPTSYVLRKARNASNEHTLDRYLPFHISISDPPRAPSVRCHLTNRWTCSTRSLEKSFTSPERSFPGHWLLAAHLSLDKLYSHRILWRCVSFPDFPFKQQMECHQHVLLEHLPRWSCWTDSTNSGFMTVSLLQDSKYSIWNTYYLECLLFGMLSIWNTLILY